MPSLRQTVQKDIDKGKIGEVTICVGTIDPNTPEVEWRDKENTKMPLWYSNNKRYDVYVDQDGAKVLYKSVPVLAGAKIGYTGWPFGAPKDKIPVLVAIAGKGNHQGAGHGAMIIARIPAAFEAEKAAEEHAPQAKPAVHQQRASNRVGNTVNA